jgi:hypothetical protein
MEMIRLVRGQKMYKFPINVSKKILADVSSGIYRTPANALKEVVSNAFDAGAHRVHISTNAPYFDVFTCEDDGEGIYAEDFKKIMTRIGASGKRVEGKLVSQIGRPIIGKIGIGLLAVAQICNKFSVISKKKGKKTYFHAMVDLKQFGDVEKERNYQQGSGDINLGTYEIEDGLEDEVGSDRHYTKIVMEDIKEGFRNNLVQEEDKQRFRFAEKAATNDCFVEFINDLKLKPFNEVAQYDQLIWELGLLCPVEYIENGPLPDNSIIRKEIIRLKKYDFKVFVDGYEIRKPIKFPTSEELSQKGADYMTYPYISFDKQVGGAKLRFTGYVFHQRKRILPAELQGILIRIKGVAVGTYDRSFLHYPKAEGPMFNQLSGEIDVEEGLEEALNIDRNSFNETHQHYLCLKAFLWDYLGGDNGVFKDIRKRSKERQDALRKKEAKQGLEKMQNAIKDILGLDIKVGRKDIEGETLYVFNKREKNLTFLSHSFWARDRRERLIQEKIILAFISAKEKSNSIETFEKNFLTVLSCGK